jgi:hypothetical protein
MSSISVTNIEPGTSRSKEYGEFSTHEQHFCHIHGARCSALHLVNPLKNTDSSIQARYFYLVTCIVLDTSTGADCSLLLLFVCFFLVDTVWWRLICCCWDLLTQYTITVSQIALVVPLHFASFLNNLRNENYHLVLVFFPLHDAGVCQCSTTFNTRILCLCSIFTSNFHVLLHVVIIE